jgi:SOS-response transcriptional repressor LexA
MTAGNMPHSLSDRQKEILAYIREYVAKNECSPRLDEISAHFNIKPPTVHKILEALQSKGYLYFGRDSISGFFIRLIERAGSAEMVTEIVIAGKIDQYGEIYEFPKKFGHFSTVLIGAKPDNLFALFFTADIPQVSLCNQDIVIFDISKKPQPGDICIAPIGDRLFLIRVASKTYDEITPSLVVAQQYPIPEKLGNPNIKQKLNWTPLTYDEANHEYFIQIAEEQHWPMEAISPDFVVATALRLIRTLAF